MSELGKKFAQEGGAKCVALGVNVNSNIDKDAFVKALFNGGPDDKVISPLKDAAEAEKVPGKLFMNLIEKGLEIGAQKELAAGSIDDVKVNTARIVQMENAPSAKEIQMHKSLNARSA